MNSYDFNRIHFYQYDDLYILIDINSDSIHQIDEMTYHLLQILKETNDCQAAIMEMQKAGYQKDEVQEVINEIDELAEEGILFSSDEEILRFMPEQNPIVKAMCLHIAHDCNLRCPYCFADQGPYGGDLSLMDEDTGVAAIDFLFEASGNRKNLNIDFFGGEPLMNFDVVKELILYIGKKSEETGKVPELTLTTNALLLDKEKGDFLKKHEISVVLSIDGRPEVHDKMRFTANQKGSYDTVMKNIQEFIKDGYSKYIVRGTFTSENLDFVKDLQHLSDYGLKNLSIEPVVAPESASYAIKESDIPVVLESYEELTRLLEKNEEFNFFHFNIDIYKGPCLPKRISACGAGHEYLAISPKGDIYPCHQFVGNLDFKMGTVQTGYKKDIGKTLQNANVLNKQECMSCWARFYCSGGCHASNHYDRGDLMQVYRTGCELQKKRIECAIALVLKKNNRVAD